MVRAVNMAATQTEDKDAAYWSDYWKLEGPPKLVRQTNKMAPDEYDNYESAYNHARDKAVEIADYLIILKTI